MEDYVRIPKRRIGVVIGKNGIVKKKIEEKLDLKIEVDEEGTAVIKSLPSADPLACWKGRDVVKAIARGFSPHKAYKLFDDSVILEVVDLEDFTGKSRNSLKRVKGRIIGKDGKTRKIIETSTGCFLSVYGRTISFIGTFEDVYDAKKAVEMLLRGAEHSTVYRFLENIKKKKKKVISLWKE